MDKIQITLTTPVSAQEDQTPTPTKFLKQCEDIGLFNDLQRVNPFDETFKKAIDTQYSLLKYPLSAPNPDETLNTPTPFQIGGVDVSKSNSIPENLSLTLDKEALDLTDKPLVLSEKSLDLTGKALPKLRSPHIKTEILADENSNVSSESTRSPITYSIDPDRESLTISSTPNRKFMLDTILSNLKTENISKSVPIKTKQVNPTSESIKKFILNKKKIRNNLNTELKSKSDIIVDRENIHDILMRTPRSTEILSVSNVSSLHMQLLKSDNEGFDSMVERLEALNSMKSFPSPPPELIPLLPSNRHDLTDMSSTPEIEITPISSSDKMQISRKQDEVAVPLLKKKTRELTKEEKRQQILERNRLAAKRSRERQKVQQHALELRLKEKEKECKLLRLEIRNLKMKLLSKEQDIDNIAHVKAQEMLSRALGNT